ncbi:hypothetical protein GCM10027578_26480 [Spirosoma luteolum]
MALNLLTFLSDQFTPGVIDQLSAQLGEQPDQLRKAAQGAIPVLLGGLAKRTQSSGGAAQLVNFLEKGNYANMPYDISQVSDTKQETAEAVATGRSFLSEVLGTNTSRAGQLLGEYSGVQAGSAETVLALAATVLMGALGRQEQEKGLSALNLSTLLAGQASAFTKALPTGLASLGSLLGFESLATPAGHATRVQGTDNLSGTITSPNIPKSPDGDRQRENVRWLSWAIFPIALLIIALLVQKCHENANSIDGVSTDSTARAEPNAVEDTSAATRASVIDAHGQVADSTAPGALGMRDSADTATRVDSAGAGTAPDVITQVELPGGRRLKVAERSFNGQLATFLASKPKNPERTFTFDNLTFETGSARITSTSRRHVDDLIEIMKAYPGLAIRVEGHTDNVGNAATNLTLSRDRAAAVKTALVAAGVAGDRVATQGFGDTRPTAPNTTPAGRQKNRRIDVAVTKL